MPRFRQPPSASNIETWWLNKGMVDGQQSLVTYAGPSEVNGTRANIQANGLTGNTRENFSHGLRNIYHADICISQWRQDSITLEEALR